MFGKTTASPLSESWSWQEWMSIGLTANLHKHFLVSFTTWRGEALSLQQLRSSRARGFDFVRG